MTSINDHLISSGSLIKKALIQLDTLAADAILFVVTDGNILLGSLTDGDVRRGLIKGKTSNDIVDEFIQKNPKFILKGTDYLQKIIEYRNQNYKIIPILNSDFEVIKLINLRDQKSYLPIDSVIMAGGKGTRLKPLTNTTPKPLIKVGNKPILEHHIDRLKLFGIDDIWLAINYLGNQIEDYFGDGNEKNLSIKYINEDEPLGTIGAVSKVDDFVHKYILVTNSDLLTNINYEHLFLDFIKQDADFSVVTIPYSVDIPYAVLETDNGHIVNFKEKPTYTYYSNGGIYLMKREILKYIPKSKFFNATDLIEALINDNLKIISYPLSEYWLDIGRIEDYEKANRDINHINF